MYPDRTATTGAPLAIDFAKLIDPPAIFEGGTGAVPAFFCGAAQAVGGLSLPSSNKPLLFAGAYNSWTPEFTGIAVMGAGHADYAIRIAGDETDTGFSDYFEYLGYIDEAFFGLTRTQTPDGGGSYTPEVYCNFVRQSLGDFTGGEATPVAAEAEQTDTVTFDDDLLNVYVSFVGPTLASTVEAPEALFMFNVQPADDATYAFYDKYGAFKIGAAGISLVGLFNGEVETNVQQGGANSINAHCRDATNHYLIRVAERLSFTICTESAWNTFDYTNYTPKFSDPDLPDLLDDLWNGNATYKMLSCYGTDLGFLFSYLKFEEPLWQPKFLLVDREWTTVHHITATGDATTEAILAQGVRDPLDPPDEPWDFASNAISMMADDGYVWMLGGTGEVPLIVEAVAPAIEEEEPVDDTLRLRTWGFSLDGHDFYVLRIETATLVYDLTTGQWSEWQSPDLAYLRAHCGQNWVGMTGSLATVETDVVAGDDTVGILWVLDPTSGRDDLTEPNEDEETDAAFPRKVMGGIPANGRDSIPCGAVQMAMALGSPSQEGATIQLQFSDDMGQSWTDCGAQEIIAADYTAVVEWRSLGRIRQPGRIFEFSDDGATVRISGADMR